MKPVVKKWMPAAVVPATIAALALGASISANAQADLEPKTAEQVLEMIAAADVESFSGRFRTSTSLGIPELPDAGSASSFGPPHAGPSGGDDAGTAAEDRAEGGGADQDGETADSRLGGMLNLLSGSHEARVFVDGGDKARLQVLNEMEERNVILNGTSLWVYDSEENAAVHATLPAAPSQVKESWREQATADVPTPEQLADRFLEHADPTTEVTVEEGSTVAGRDVYNLVLTPKTDETLVADVTIGVDAETGVPLAVTVAAVDQEEPAVSVEFTEFTPEAPDAGLFDFEAPAGATVEEKDLPSKEEIRRHLEDRKAKMEDHQAESGDHKAPRGELDGRGWDAVVQVPADQVPAELTESAMLDELSEEVDGGRLLHTSLVNVLITDDGRAFAGSVPVSRLQAVADAG